MIFFVIKNAVCIKNGNIYIKFSVQIYTTLSLSEAQNILIKKLFSSP